MLLIPCPHCGERNSSEFRYVGESKSRPDPTSATPAEWRDYLYIKVNDDGWAKETWYHRAGCRRYFGIERHKVTNEVRDPQVRGDKVGQTEDALASQSGSSDPTTDVQ